MTTSPSAPAPAPSVPTNDPSSRSGISGALRRVNPVLDRELRQRSRSGRSIVVMTIFLFLTIAVAYLSYIADSSSQFDDPFQILASSPGRTVFEWVLLLELTLLLFVIPGLSAGAITGERDRQTLAPLQVTLLSPTGIFFGKVLSANSFVMLLVVSSTPVMAAAYLLGGLTIGQVIWAMLALVVIGFLLAVIGVACSALTNSTMTATLFAYGLVLLLTVGTVMAFVAIGIVYVMFVDPEAIRPPDWVALPLAFNPFVALTAAGGDLNELTFNPWPLSELKGAFLDFIRPDDTVWDGVVEEDLGVGAPPPRVDGDGFGLQMWLSCMLGLGGMAALMAWRGVRRLRTPTKVIRQ